MYITQLAILSSFAVLVHFLNVPCICGVLLPLIPSTQSPTAPKEGVVSFTQTVLPPLSSQSIQTPQRQSAVHLTGSVLPDQVDIQPVPGGVKAGRLLVVEPVERVDIPGDPSVGSPRRKVLAKRDQQPLHIAPKPRYHVMTCPVCV